MTPISRNTADEIGDHVHAVLAAGAAGDLECAMRSLDQIVTGHGAWGAYDLAGTIVAELLGEFPPAGGAGFWTLDFPDIDDASYDLRWAARFINSYANGEEETSRALYRAAILAGEIRACLGTLVSSTVTRLRRE